jgi:hypothetical protein
VLAVGVRTLEEARNWRLARGGFKAHKKLSFSLERFKVSLDCMTRGRIVSTSISWMWKKRAEKVRRKIMDLPDDFLDELGLGRQKEDRLEPLRTSLERTAELAQLVEGFELEPYEAELREISRELHERRAGPQSGNPLIADKAFEMVQGVEDMRIHKLLRRPGVAQEDSEASIMETLEAAALHRGG